MPHHHTTGLKCVLFCQKQYKKKEQPSSDLLVHLLKAQNCSKYICIFSDKEYPGDAFKLLSHKPVIPVANTAFRAHRAAYKQCTPKAEYRLFTWSKLVSRRLPAKIVLYITMLTNKG